MKTWMSSPLPVRLASLVCGGVLLLAGCDYQTDEIKTTKNRVVFTLNFYDSKTAFNRLHGDKSRRGDENAVTYWDGNLCDIHTIKSWKDLRHEIEEHCLGDVEHQRYQF